MAAEVDKRTELLAAQPGIGRERTDLKAGLRSTVVEKVYLIFYRFNASTLEVVRILHGARDLEAEFMDD